MKMKAAIALMAFPIVAFGGSLIGTVVPPYPTGTKSEGGACVADPDNPDDSCAFSIDVARENGQLYLYLEKRISPETAKHAQWRVLDRMPYPRLKDGEAVIFALCERNARPDQSVIAVVKREDSEWYTVIRKAYKADLVKGRFGEVPVTGIRCSNEGWGV